MNATRSNADRNYRVALAAWNVAVAGSCLATFEAADANLNAIRSELLALEKAHPTSQEKNSFRRELLRGNRGMRINK